MNGSRDHTEQFDRMTKIVQLSRAKEMGGLKGVAKSGLREKSLAVTVNRGRVFPSVNPGACSPFSLPF